MADIAGQVNNFINFGINWPLFWTFMGLLAFLVGIFIMALIGFFAMRFKYRVQIIERRGERSQIIYYDWGRLVKENEGVYKLHLLKNRTTITMPEFKHLTILAGNFLRKEQITVYKKSTGSWAFIDYDEIKNENLNLDLTDNDVELYMNTIEKQDRKFQNKRDFGYWVQLAAPILTVILFIVAIIVLTKNLNNVTSGLAHVAASFETSAKTMAQCVVEPAAQGFSG